MRAEIINTGSELLLGHVVNTHLAFFGKELFGLGFRIDRQVAIPDGEAIKECLREAFARKPDAIFVTGGLGPTTDDITRELLADMLGVKLEPDSVVMRMIEERFASRGFVLNERNARQAMVPEGMEPIYNDWGTAPGLYMPRSETNPPVFVLPGPPRELLPMFLERVAPRLREMFSERKEMICRVWRIHGMGESTVEAAVGESLLAIPGLELGYCARSGEVDVRVVGDEGMLASAGKIIENRLAGKIYAHDGGTMEATVLNLLREKHLTVVTAESCTGGMVANRLTNVPGASEIFLGGWVTYANEMKAAELNIDLDLITKHGAVSEAVAAAMAENARRVSGADFALSTTGIAGPSGGTEEKPVGTVFIGLASTKGVVVTKHFFPSERETFKVRVTQTSLNLLREALEG